MNAVIEASQVLGKPLVTPSAMFVEKSFFQTMHGYSEDSFATEDHDFVLRAKKWYQSTLFKGCADSFFFAPCSQRR